MKRLAIAAAGMAAAMAAAQSPGVELRAYGGRENLDHGYQDWTEAGADLSWRGDEGRLFQVRGRQTERYGLRDRELAALAAWSPAALWNLSLEVTGAADAEVLPEWSATATAYRQLGDGWVATGSWKQTRYATSDVSTATAGLERYLDRYRFAYTAYLARPEGAAWSPTHRLTATWYGDGPTRVEIGGARGRESENTPLGLVTSDVRNVTLSAVLGVSGGWALTLDLERHRQGDLYTRQLIRLGARVLF